MFGFTQMWNMMLISKKMQVDIIQQVANRSVFAVIQNMQTLKASFHLQVGFGFFLNFGICGSSEKIFRQPLGLWAINEMSLGGKNISKYDEKFIKVPSDVSEMGVKLTFLESTELLHQQTNYHYLVQEFRMNP